MKSFYITFFIYWIDELPLEYITGCFTTIKVNFWSRLAHHPLKFAISDRDFTKRVFYIGYRQQGCWCITPNIAHLVTTQCWHVLTTGIQSYCKGQLNLNNNEISILNIIIEMNESIEMIKIGVTNDLEFLSLWLMSPDLLWPNNKLDWLRFGEVSRVNIRTITFLMFVPNVI